MGKPSAKQTANQKIDSELGAAREARDAEKCRRKRQKVSRDRARRELDELSS